MSIKLKILNTGLVARELIMRRMANSFEIFKDPYLLKLRALCVSVVQLRSYK